MPFADDSFDFIYCSAAFKNFSEPVKSLDEMYRVLRSGGVALVEDLCRDASLAEIDAYVKKSGRGRIDAWLTSWAFRFMLIKRAYTKDEFSRMAEQSQFDTCQIQVDSIGLETRFTKPAQVELGVW